MSDQSLFDNRQIASDTTDTTVTHNILVKRAGRWLRKTERCNAVLLEAGYGSAGEIPDAIGWKPSGRSVLVECKAGRSDFFADRNKGCRRTDEGAFAPGGGMGAERWYMVPAGLVLREEVPEGWGLLYFHHRSERVVKIAKPSPESKLTERGALKERKLLIGCVAQVQHAANGWFEARSQHSDHNLGRAV